MNEDPRRSAAIFFEVWGLMIAAGLTAYFFDHPIARVGACLLMAALVSRMFNVFHDTCHGAMLRNQPWKRRIMVVYGYLVLTPPPVWRPEHAAHHRETGVYDRPVPGEFPLWSTDKYRRAGKRDRFAYRITRAPVAMVFGYVTAFLFTWGAAPFFSNPVRYWRNGLALGVHIALTALFVWIDGWAFALSVFNGPIAIAAAAGVYFFYVQHNAPGLRFAPVEQRDPADVAMLSTTFFRMPAFMNWATGNIGYHHIHHFSSRIPFYRLPDANAALPELKGEVVETSWRPSDIVAALRANLYDPATGAMTTYRDAMSS